MNYIFFIIFLIIFLSCNADSNKKIEGKKSRFTTSDASEIFFKNVRQIYYDRVEMRDSKLNIYRIREKNVDSDYPNLFLAIVINWRNDEAYILLEPNEFVPKDEIKIKWLKDSIHHGEYFFNYADKTAHFNFAGQIYSSIISNHKLTLILENEEIPLLNKDRDKESFRKTMKDYYRLIDLQ